MARFIIYVYGGYNECSRYTEALICADKMVRNHWKETGALGESFAVVYDKLNRTRVIVWLTEDLKIKFRKLF